ncbi:hypothetical protein FDENT_8543 [Fusarium denticulatum]|uniref:DUF6546 domain-containing protein n=1 Tax=Fusarium denticulatum TaxID=48507 RepID=A0A8H5TX50_9HYPO|nr:hypothetical protein FDENT_8543 [Fusarium denticulatum]
MVTPRSQTRAEKAFRSSWAFLPQEIRRMILEDISSQRQWSLSAEGLKTIILQRHLIRRVYLNIKLPLYMCRQCPRYIPSIVPVELTKEALQRLTKALATWEPTHHITLELNAYSPSDPEHCFKNHLYGLKHENDGNLLEKQKASHDPDHSWIEGKQLAPPTTAVIHQLFRTVITEIYLARVMTRDGLPTWPQYIRSVTIFEDFNEQIMEAIRREVNPTITVPFMQIETRRHTKYELGEAFAVKSRSLEHLSVSFMIDARDFFTACKMMSDWPRLRSLILTTPLMTKGSRGRISDFLVNAGRVAQKMQHLKSLAIWHCSRDDASAVIFHKNENGSRKVHGSATLTWRGTRDFDFSEEVVETWQKVVCTCNSHQGYVGQCDSHQLLCRIEREEGEIISHGDAIHHLRLPDGVIDPTSLWQIRQEGILQREAWAVEAEPDDGSEEDQ